MKLDPLHLLASLATSQYFDTDHSQLSLLDWKAIELLAVEHGVAPLLHQCFTRTGRSADIPEQVRDFFKAAYYQSIAKNALFLSELQRILSILIDVDVDVILLKGVSLVRKIYSEFALRPMTDLDLMVRPDDIKKVSGLFKQFGYEEQKSTYHIVFWGGPAKNVIIEIHWNIMNSNLENTSHEVDWIWKDAFWEHDAYSLRLEKEFLYLVGHMMIQHGTSPTRLIWLYDLCLFLGKYFYDMDWDFIFENSTLLGWNRVLVESIQNCADYFPSQFTDLAITKFPVNFSKQQKGQVNRGWIPRAMRGMSVDRGIRTAKSMIFPGFSYMQWRYHLATRKYILMYYPKRWFELVKGVITKK